MKKLLFFSLIFFSTFCLTAQTESETTKKAEFGFKLDAKIGYATLIQNDQVDLNGTVNAGDFLFFFAFPEGNSVSLGIEMLEFKANSVSAGEGFALDHQYLRIPLNYRYSLSILEDQLDDKLSVYAGAGLYANTLLREKIQTLEGTEKNKNQGWNTGFNFEVGIDIKVSRDINFGIGFQTQSDFSKMSKNDIKRKLEGITTVNFTIQFNVI